MKNINDDFNLHSQKVKKLLGEKPPILIRYGTLIGILLVIIIGIILFLIPYPNGEGESVYKHFFEDFKTEST